MTNKTDIPEVIYAGMARDLYGKEIGGYWQEEPQGEPKYILADTSISKDEHLEAMAALRKACDDAFWKYEQTGPATISRAILNATIEGKE